MGVEIMEIGGHWVAFIDGKFFCSGDTYLEVVRELSKEGY